MTRSLWLVLGLLFALPVAAQDPPGAGLPQPMQGPWYRGECRAPDALLHLTARAAAVLPAEGAAALFRLVTVVPLGGWTLGTAAGAAAPRLLLRQDGAALETAEPEAKLRQDRLPGATPVIRWQRCPGPPPALALLHGEGLAALAALEQLEAACAETQPCLEALVAQADLSGDGALGTAELARLARGLAWVVAVQEGGTPETLATATGLGGLAGLVAARLLVESLDFDGDGKLSPAELAQDRIAFGVARGTGAGAPMGTGWTGPGLEALRGLLSGLGSLK